ncbi:hypothetical protein DFJ77DRAFT_253640 [Powellomyces hirtus]|nr:hypothetical protein DFJ77DRAFT_253640 [Powellomyces hirtus]
MRLTQQHKIRDKLHWFAMGPKSQSTSPAFFFVGKVLEQISYGCSVPHHDPLAKWLEMEAHFSHVNIICNELHLFRTTGLVFKLCPIREIMRFLCEFFEALLIISSAQAVLFTLMNDFVLTNIFCPIQRKLYSDLQPTAHLLRVQKNASETRTLIYDEHP